jgi:uncharacterized membrane protein YeaQ/YmgE (transglycosylase-associated protein family)
VGGIIAKFLMPEDSELAEFILATILGIFGAFVLGDHLVLLSLREQQI